MFSNSSYLLCYLNFKLQLLLREVPHLAKYMPVAKDARRMIPDPDNEPDFERISKVFPLPDAQAAALELTLAARNAGASKMGGSGLQQQLQGVTNNNWSSSYPSINTDFNRSESMPRQRSITPSMASEAAEAQASNRVKDAIVAAIHLQAELGSQERQNLAMVMKFAAQRQQQQANPGITQSLESILWKFQQNNFLSYNFR